METETGDRVFTKSDLDGRKVEIRAYRRYGERFADISSGRIRGPQIILRTSPDGDLVVRVEGDPKAFKILKNNEIVREI